MKEFDRLIEIMDILRGKNGCPWDMKQTRESLKGDFLEEVYEVLEAMDIGGDNLKGELGDLLLHIVFQAKISDEKEEFNIKDVVQGINNKLIRRHPHIFKKAESISEEDVIKNWEVIKNTEKEIKERKYILDGIPKHLPPLLRAQKIQEKVSIYGFDWENKEDVFFKVQEEIEEVKLAIKNKDTENLEEEIGDLLFSLTNYARHCGLNIDTIMRKSNDKFEKRFNYIEDNCNIKDSDLKVMEKLWEKSKF
ncbi:nucleoside triphosphate pyrophosphohydrolase [Fusobacterium sp. IOR10]|uniref:nucleoside triphosphate pyrophosphohydrolase n=1 Tax=Fusobacterium sp. IOR10 TaxID=2665157 RepID=UPI0013CFBC29|nr:nucleoside triphosphate pyrophosphohydrolase [Fusobacterium sp. IOR10]